MADRAQAESTPPPTPGEEPGTGTRPIPVEARPSEDRVPEGALIAGRYRCEGMLGEGGFGVVYAALDQALKRPVAVKVLRRSCTQNRELYARFQQEARAAASVPHPNIVTIFDLGEDDKNAFIVMERLFGEPLSARIQRSSSLSERFIVQVGLQLADAMEAAHNHGLIHRDLKPSNIFLARMGSRGDVVKVIDFGIVKLAHAELDHTTTGQLLGTPLYMAPEQIRRRGKLSAQVDIYAAGMVLYHALTQSFPYSAEHQGELLFRIVESDPIPIRQKRPNVSPGLAAIIERCLEKDPDARFAGMGELAKALRGLETADPHRAAAAEVERPAGFERTMELPDIEGEKAASSSPARAAAEPRREEEGPAQPAAAPNKDEPSKAGGPHKLAALRWVAAGLVGAAAVGGTWLAIGSSTTAPANDEAGNAAHRAGRAGADHAAKRASELPADATPTSASAQSTGTTVDGREAAGKNGAGSEVPTPSKSAPTPSGAATPEHAAPTDPPAETPSFDADGADARAAGTAREKVRLRRRRTSRRNPESGRPARTRAGGARGRRTPVVVKGARGSLLLGD